VLGARQVGKTTLVEHVLHGQGALFLNFDVEVDKARFLAAASLPPPDALRSFGNPPVLVIDEAQRLPEAPRIVKGWHDARFPVKILLLGSSSLDLLDKAAESLTGRNRKLVLPPLLFSETLSEQEWATSEIPREHLCQHFAPQLCALLLQRLTFGSYPEVVLSTDPARLLRELSADYLWKDVLQTGLVKTPDLIKRLLLLIGPSGGLRGVGERVGDPAPNGAPERGTIPGSAGADLRHFPAAVFQHQPTQRDRQRPQAVLLGHRHPQRSAQRLLH
jgi:predicted AAA+ superfamily ATPase